MTSSSIRARWAVKPPRVSMAERYSVSISSIGGGGGALLVADYEPYCVFSAGISLIIWNSMYTSEKVIIRWTLLTEVCYLSIQLIGECHPEMEGIYSLDGVGLQYQSRPADMSGAVSGGGKKIILFVVWCVILILVYAAPTEEMGYKNGVSIEIADL